MANQKVILMKKIFAMREPIPKELWTSLEYVEYWLVKRGLGGCGLYCKWHKTLIKEITDNIDLDTSKIRIIKKDN